MVVAIKEWLSSDYDLLPFNVQWEPAFSERGSQPTCFSSQLSFVPHFMKSLCPHPTSQVSSFKAVELCLFQNIPNFYELSMSKSSSPFCNQNSLVSKSNCTTRIITWQTNHSPPFECKSPPRPFAPGLLQRCSLLFPPMRRWVYNLVAGFGPSFHILEKTHSRLLAVYTVQPLVSGKIQGGVGKLSFSITWPLFCLNCSIITIYSPC